MRSSLRASEKRPGLKRCTARDAERAPHKPRLAAAEPLRRAYALQAPLEPANYCCHPLYVC